MAIDCSDVPPNVTYNCANPWGQGCTSDKHFDLASLWEYTQSIEKACPNDPRLFLPPGATASPRNASLTQASCAATAGPNWTYYPGADIWARLTAWKFPLLQLVASFPRPPLSFAVECFVILHLLGDPIDTIKNLLAKMSSCQIIAQECKAECGRLLEKLDGEDEDRDWKAWAIVVDAYGEWNEDQNAKVALQQGFLKNPQHKKRLASAIRQTGRALAADRSTKFLPIIVAQAFFIGAVGIAMFRTASAAGESASSDTIFINVEAHSIAFTALYFWIIPAVFLGSIIGVSQTEAAIPEILKGFKGDIDRLDLPSEVRLPNKCLDDRERRIFNGGVYSWQPQKNHPPYDLLSYVIVIMGTATGMAVSALVPPDGWDCRHIGEILILTAWLVSAQSDMWLSHVWPSDKEHQRKLFWCTGFKDLLITIATMGGIILIQVGLFNSCECYTLGGKTGLALPQMPDTAKILFHRLNTVYPGFTFACIGVELIVVPLLICVQYKDGVRTFVQRDDKKSNAKWLWRLLSKVNRTRTFSSEDGPSGNPYELYHLTRYESGEPEGTPTEHGYVVDMSAADEQCEDTDSTSQSSVVGWPSEGISSATVRQRSNSV